MVELADTLDLGSSGRPWGFESLQAHQSKTASHGDAVLLCGEGIRRDSNPKGRESEAQQSGGLLSNERFKTTEKGVAERRMRSIRKVPPGAPKQSVRRASESFGRFFARDAKERKARFVSGSNVQENPLVIATVRSKSLGLLL